MDAAAFSGLTQVDAASTTRRNPPPAAARRTAPAREDQPEQQDGRQCKDEDRDRAQQDQAKGRVGRDHLRLEGRVHSES